MKLIKLITAVVMSFGLMIAQPPTQGGNQGGTQGPPPCDQWLNSDMAHDMNDDGVVDEGDCPGQGQGPDPFQQAFMTTMQNGGTPDEAFEAVAAVFHQMAVECDDCEMPEEEFQEGKAEAKAAFDAVLANGGTPEEAFHAAMETSSNDGPGTCDVCGYEYGGPDDHHGHCRECGAEMNADEDWQAHCEENPDHCKPQAGDTCGYVGPSGDECGYVHSGDEGEDHHHCDHCGLAVNSGEEMHNHMQADHPDMMEQHDDGGGDHDGSQHYPNNHWDGNCGAMMNGESEYWLDSDGDPDNGPEDGPYAVWHEDADGNPVNCGPGPEGGDHDGSPPFEDVDTNGDGSIDRDEARDFFGDEPNFDEEYDKVDANGDGMVDHAEYMGAVDVGGDHDGGGTCDVCGYEYSGPDDHHGHCRVCDAEMNADEDWQSHCEENPDHCKAQAGDVCGFRGWDGQGEECGYVHTGDSDEDHHHCDHCGVAVNSGEEMHNHLEADHPDRPARDNCEALYRGLDSFINENGDAIAVWATNGDGTPACGQDDDGNN